MLKEAAVRTTEVETARRWMRECEAAVRRQRALIRKRGAEQRLRQEAKAQLTDQQEILRLQGAYLGYIASIYEP